MKLLSGIAIAVILLSGCAQMGVQTGVGLGSAPSSIPVTSNGYWEGVAYQTDTRSSWDIAGYIRPGQPSRMFYPSLNCAGSWSFAGGAKDGSLNYRETIYRDERNRCLKSVNLSVKAQGQDQVLYKTYDSKGRVNSTATLRPAEVPIPHELEGSWTGFASNQQGTKTEIQVRLSRKERSMLHQFVGKCTYDLYLVKAKDRTIAVDTDSGVSESGAQCDGQAMYLYSLKDSRTLIMRTYQGNRIKSEVTLKRI